MYLLLESIDLLAWCRSIQYFQNQRVSKRRRNKARYPLVSEQVVSVVAHVKGKKNTSGSTDTVKWYYFYSELIG